MEYIYGICFTFYNLWKDRGHKKNGFTIYFTEFILKKLYLPRRFKGVYAVSAVGCLIPLLFDPFTLIIAV